MRRAGARAGAVSLLGVILTFGPAIAVARATGRQWTASAFIATAATATSAGISARVLAHLGKLRTEEGRTILGAAVLDDVVGLLVLTVVAGIARDSFSAASITVLLIEAVAFVAVLVVLGPPIIDRISPLMEAPRIARAPFSIAIIALLGLSVAANRIRLTAVVGRSSPG
jgi:Kef-type K+ transport system membrane component KefB